MQICYQDATLVVCQKEPGELSEHTPDQMGLPDRLAAELGVPTDEIFVVHRLDRTTGGLIALARDKKTAAYLSKEIQSGRFVKEYIALAEGIVENGDMLDQLYFDRGRSQSFVVKKRPGAKEARLHTTTLATWDTTALPDEYHNVDKLSLCRVRLQTGRTHQIRVQFAARQHPLVGDRKYGAKCHTKACPLWAAHLAFTHPNGKTLDFTLPTDALFPELAEVMPAIDWGKME